MRITKNTTKGPLRIQIAAQILAANYDLLIRQEKNEFEGLPWCRLQYQAGKVALEAADGLIDAHNHTCSSDSRNVDEVKSGAV